MFMKPHNKKATLGIAVIAVALAGLAPPTAQAQTESYITASDEAAACEGVCNTFVPPQDEQECRDLANERWQTEYFRSTSALGRLQTNRKAELQESYEIFVDEEDASFAVLKERVHIAYGVYALHMAGAAAALTACLASITATGPAAIGAAAICSSAYAASVAGFALSLKREVDAAWKVRHKNNELARHRADDRDGAINALYDKREENENALSESNLALIDEDLALCLERVNG